MNTVPMSKNKTFCMAPWVHMNIAPNGDVYPCCLMPLEHPDNEEVQQESGEICPITKETALEIISTECNGDSRTFGMGSLMNESLKEIWNNEKMRELRRNMLCGKKSEYCTTCYKEEEVGHISARQNMNTTYGSHYKYVKETKEDGTFDRFNLIYWDFRLNNVCNFKCRMCGPGYSSSWEQEMRKTFDIDGEYPKIDIQGVLEDVEPLYDIVEEVYFAGGEPLIADHHYTILKNLIQRGRNQEVRLSYNTNFSTLKYKDNDVLELWKRFPLLSIQVSCDGIEKRGELIRKGFDWQRFLDNYKNFRNKFPYQRLTINCVVQILNSFHFIDVHKELYLRGIIKDWDDFNLCLLHSPDYLSITLLDSESRKILGEQIKYHIKNYLVPAKANKSIGQYMSVLKLLSADKNEHLLPTFKSYMSALDIIRNENSSEVFPELERILKNV